MQEEEELQEFQKPRKVEVDGKKFLVKNCEVCGFEVWYQRRSKTHPMPKTCPECSADYWDKPREERALFLIQKKFLTNDRSSPILGEMYYTLFDYSTFIIKQELKKSTFKMEDQILIEKAQDMVFNITDRYKKDCNFYITDSFGGYLKKVVKGVLYGDQVNDKVHITSIHDPIYEDSELGDFLPELTNETFESSLLDSLSDPAIEILNKVLDRIVAIILRDYGHTHAALFLNGIYLNLKKPNSFQSTKFMHHYSLKIRQHIDYAQLLILKLLKEGRN